MFEKEGKLSERIVKLSVGHRYEVMNSESKVMVRHEIIGIGPNPFLSLFGEGGEVLAKKDYRMFGAVMGCPDTASVTNVPEFFEDRAERFNIYFTSFKQFYRDYFSNYSSQNAFLVYLHDFSFDSWNRENIEGLVKSLNEHGVCVTQELEGEIDIDGEEIYHTVLLFERPNDIALD